MGELVGLYLQNNGGSYLYFSKINLVALRRNGLEKSKDIRKGSK